MSDVTAEEVENERERAHAIARAGCISFVDTEIRHSLTCTMIATALATVRKEARREALETAVATAANTMCTERICCSCGDAIEGAIRALMGSGT